VPVGIAPQDWSIPLRFKPAAPEDVLPVVEYQPTPAPTVLSATAQPTEVANKYGVSISLDKSVALPDGYILYGSTHWTDATIPPYHMSTTLAAVKDANGNEISFDYAQSELSPGRAELVYYWAFKINATPLTGPVNLSFVLDASIPADGSFTFDPGLKPQVGQTWDVNVDVPVNEHLVHIISAEYLGENALTFSMKADAGVVGAQLIDLQHPPFFGGGGGGGVPEDQILFVGSVYYQNEIPLGPLTITINELDILIPGDWQILWTPNP